MQALFYNYFYLYFMANGYLLLLNGENEQKILVSNMWTDSKKWQEMRRNGGHSVVRFDVFCGQCNKQIGENVGADDISKCGLNSDKPMEIFCNSICAKEYEKEKGVTLCNNGWHKIFTK